MADSTRVRGSIAGDCEGEGGRRGKRGHRGRPGPGFDQEAPFWPPFPTTGAFVTTTIYARLAPIGSDTDGDGSVNRPFASFARAILNVPHFINAGCRFIIDITGLGTETLPQDWAMPPIVAPADLFLIADQSFLFATPLTIRAYPQLSAAAAPTQLISAGTVSAVGPGLTQLNVPGAGWTPGALKGKQVLRSSGAFAATCCIFDNSATDLFLCNTPGAFNGGTGPLVLAPGETVNIVEPSATLLAPPSGRGNAMLWSMTGNLNFQGVALACTVPSAGNGGPAFVNALNPAFELCTLDEVDFINCGPVQVAPLSTTVTGYVNAWSSQLTPRRSYWNGVGAGYFAATGDPVIGALNCNNSEWRQTVFDGCFPVAKAAGVAGIVPAVELGFLNCWWLNTQGDAINAVSPTRIDVTDCQIDGSQAINGYDGNAITLSGPLQSLLSGVTGTGNANLGVRTDDGAHVLADAGVSVTGTAGNYKNGNNVVGSWGSGNDVDLATLSRINS
jgi:hypothetical protein